MKLDIWRLHPTSVQVEPAEKSIKGTANEAGVKWCGPYAYANKSGWWIYPPVDVDIMWKGGKEYEHRLHTNWSDMDHHAINRLLRIKDGVDLNKWCPAGCGRTKFTWGAVEENVVQIWTGCIFQTPPGWCLHVRSPINCAEQPYHVMEGIIETDWMAYDIWINLVIDRQNEWIELRRNQFPPLAQFIPIRRESYEEKWEIEDQNISRDTDEANRVFEFWLQYNHKKFGCGGKQALSEVDPNITKDATTYHRERMKILGKSMEPDPDKISARKLPDKRKLPPQHVPKNMITTPKKPPLK